MPDLSQGRKGGLQPACWLCQFTPRGYFRQNESLKGLPLLGRFRWVGRQKLFSGVDMGSGTQGKEYRRGVDLLRFVACFGIVWDHARAYGADIGYLALAVFLLLTSFFAVQSFDRAEARGQGAGFWLPRAQRILMPWLVWSM